MRRLRFAPVCLTACVASMIVAATLSLAAAQEPTSVTIREAHAGWVSGNPSKPGDVYLQTLIYLRRETTESGDLIDLVQYADLTFVAIDNGEGGIRLVVAEALLVNQTLPVGSY